MLTINTQASEAFKTPWELPLTRSPLDKPVATHSEETSTSPKETVNPTVVQPEAEAETCDNSHENPGTETMVEEAPPDPTSTPAAPRSDINTRETAGEPAVESAAPAETTTQGDAPAAGNEKTPENDEENGFVTGFPLTCLFVGLMLGVFLVSLDRTIISTVRMTRVVHSPISSGMLTSTLHTGHPVHHPRISLDAGYWMVWLGIPSHSLCFPTPVWSHFHAVLAQEDIPLWHGDL